MAALGVKRAPSQSLDPVEREIRIQNIAYLVQASLDAYHSNPLPAKELEHGTTNPPRP